MVIVTVKVSFPHNEFKKLRSDIAEGFFVKYRLHARELYMGKIINLYKRDEEIATALEVRQNGSPYWYIKQIIIAASKGEIMLAKNHMKIAQKGRVKKVFVNRKEIFELNLSKEVSSREIVDLFQVIFSYY